MEATPGCPVADVGQYETAGSVVPLQPLDLPRLFRQLCLQLRVLGLQLRVLRPQLRVRRLQRRSQIGRIRRIGHAGTASQSALSEQIDTVSLDVLDNTTAPVAAGSAVPSTPPRHLSRRDVEAVWTRGPHGGYYRRRRTRRRRVAADPDRFSGRSRYNRDRGLLGDHDRDRSAGVPGAGRRGWAGGRVLARVSRPPGHFRPACRAPGRGWPPGGGALPARAPSGDRRRDALRRWRNASRRCRRGRRARAGADAGVRGPAAESWPPR
jgi:hypothetical protein